MGNPYTTNTMLQGRPLQTNGMNYARLKVPENFASLLDIDALLAACTGTEQHRL